MNWKQITTLSAIVVLGGFAFVYFRKQSELLADSCYKADGLIINSINSNGIDFTLFLKFSNKSNIDMKLEKQHYEIFVEGKKVTSVDSTNSISIQPKSDTRIPLRVTFKLTDIFKTGFQNLDKLMINHNDLKIQIKGKLYATSGVLVKIPIPIDYKATLKDFKTDPNAPKKEC